MRPWKKWLLRTVAVLAVTTAGYFAVGWWRQSQAGRQLDEARAALDADDPGWRLDQIQAARARRFPPDDRNLTKLAVAIKEDTPKEFEEFLRRADDPTPWLPERDFNRLPAAEKLADARKTRTLCKDVIDRCLKLGALTDGGVIPPPVPNPLNMSLEHTQRLRNAAALLSLNAVVLAADNDPAAAVASCRAGLNLVHGVNDEPTLVTMLIRVAVAAVAVQSTERVLGYTEPTAGLAELQAELLREADAPVLANGVRGERAMMDAIFDYMQTDPSALPVGAFDVLSRLGVQAFKARILREQLIGLKLQTRYLDVARGPSHEWAERLKAVDTSDAKGPLIELLLPATEKVALAVLRSRARLRSLAVGVACERFRQANGRWPKELTEIPKAILAEIPTDPYTGGSLKYKLLADGIVVYAVGDDKADDGGNLTYSNPKPGEDVGARLWSPPFRRAAARPEPKADDGDEK
jgi:hypothetical protein